MSVFVFGSNTQGRHGGGAARHALDKMGAVYGQARGRQGRSYAIVTCTLQLDVEKMPTLEHIRHEVISLFEHMKSNPYEEFFITPIGTGLAGWQEDVIRPLFDQIVHLPNAKFADTWIIKPRIRKG